MADTHLQHSELRGVHSLVMGHGANALDIPLMSEIRQRIDLLSRGGAPPLVLSSSHPTLFCPGWDLKVLVDADRARVMATLSEFNSLILDLFSYPGPTCSAITGHAVAAGCQLALACDLRIMGGDRPRLGFAELNLGVPMPAGSLVMLKARLSQSVVEELVLLGDGCSPERALELGVVHRIVPPSEVMNAADREVRKLGSKSSCAFSTTKRYLYGDCWQQMRQVNESAQDSFLDCWFEGDTKQRMADVVRRLSEQ